MQSLASNYTRRLWIGWPLIFAAAIWMQICKTAKLPVGLQGWSLILGAIGLALVWNAAKKRRHIRELELRAEIQARAYARHRKG